MAIQPGNSEYAIGNPKWEMSTDDPAYEMSMPEPVEAVAEEPIEVSTENLPPIEEEIVSHYDLPETTIINDDMKYEYLADQWKYHENLTPEGRLLHAMIVASGLEQGSRAWNYWANKYAAAVTEHEADNLATGGELNQYPQIDLNKEPEENWNFFTSEFWGDFPEKLEIAKRSLQKQGWGLLETVAEARATFDKFTGLDQLELGWFGGAETAADFAFQARDKHGQRIAMLYERLEESKPPWYTLRAAVNLVGGLGIDLAPWVAAGATGPVGLGTMIAGSANDLAQSHYDRTKNLHQSIFVGVVNAAITGTIFRAFHVHGKGDVFANMSPAVVARLSNAWFSGGTKSVVSYMKKTYPLAKDVALWRQFEYSLNTVYEKLLSNEVKTEAYQLGFEQVFEVFKHSMAEVAVVQATGVLKPVYGMLTGKTTAKHMTELGKHQEHLEVFQKRLNDAATSGNTAPIDGLIIELEMAINGRKTNNPLLLRELAWAKEVKRNAETGELSDASTLKELKAIAENAEAVKTSTDAMRHIVEYNKVLTEINGVDALTAIPLKRVKSKDADGNTVYKYVPRPDAARTPMSRRQQNRLQAERITQEQAQLQNRIDVVKASIQPEINTSDYKNLDVPTIAIRLSGNEALLTQVQGRLGELLSKQNRSSEEAGEVAFLTKVVGTARAMGTPKTSTEIEPTYNIGGVTLTTTQVISQLKARTKVTAEQKSEMLIELGLDHMTLKEARVELKRRHQEAEAQYTEQAKINEKAISNNHREVLELAEKLAEQAIMKHAFDKSIHSVMDVARNYDPAIHGKEADFVAKSMDALDAQMQAVEATGLFSEQQVTRLKEIVGERNLDGTWKVDTAPKLAKKVEKLEKFTKGLYQDKQVKSIERILRERSKADTSLYTPTFDAVINSIAHKIFPKDYATKRAPETDYATAIDNYFQIRQDILGYPDGTYANSRGHMKSLVEKASKNGIESLENFERIELNAFLKDMQDSSANADAARQAARKLEVEQKLSELVTELETVETPSETFSPLDPNGGNKWQKAKDAPGGLYKLLKNFGWSIDWNGSLDSSAEFLLGSTRSRSYERLVTDVEYGVGEFTKGEMAYQKMFRDALPKDVSLETLHNYSSISNNPKARFMFRIKSGGKATELNNWEAISLYLNLKDASTRSAFEAGMPFKLIARDKQPMLGKGQELGTKDPATFVKDFIKKFESKSQLYAVAKTYMDFINSEAFRNSFSKMSVQRIGKDVISGEPIFYPRIKEAQIEVGKSAEGKAKMKILPDADVNLGLTDRTIHTRDVKNIKPTNIVDPLVVMQNMMRGMAQLEHVAPRLELAKDLLQGIEQTIVSKYGKSSTQYKVYKNLGDFYKGITRETSSSLNVTGRSTERPEGWIMWMRNNAAQGSLVANLPVVAYQPLSVLGATNSLNMIYGEGAKSAMAVNMARGYATNLSISKRTESYNQMIEKSPLAARRYVTENRSAHSAQMGETVESGVYNTVMGQRINKTDAGVYGPTMEFLGSAINAADKKALVSIWEVNIQLSNRAWKNSGREKEIGSEAYWRETVLNFERTIRESQPAWTADMQTWAQLQGRSKASFAVLNMYRSFVGRMTMRQRQYAGRVVNLVKGGDLKGAGVELQSLISQTVLSSIMVATIKGPIDWAVGEVFDLATFADEDTWLDEESKQRLKEKATDDLGWKVAEKLPMVLGGSDLIYFAKKTLNHLGVDTNSNYAPQNSIASTVAEIYRSYGRFLEAADGRDTTYESLIGGLHFLKSLGKLTIGLPSDPIDELIAQLKKAQKEQEIEFDLQRNQIFIR